MRRARRVYCHGCATHFVTSDHVYRCTDCNTTTREERDDRGRLVRAFDRRGRLVYQACSTSRLTQFGEPGRAFTHGDTAVPVVYARLA